MKKFNYKKHNLTVGLIKKMFKDTIKASPLPLSTKFKYANLFCERYDISSICYLNDLKQIGFCENNFKELKKYFETKEEVFVNLSLLSNHEVEHANQEFLIRKKQKGQRLSYLEKLYISAMIVSEKFYYSMDGYYGNDDNAMEFLSQFDENTAYNCNLQEVFADISALVNCKKYHKFNFRTSRGEQTFLQVLVYNFQLIEFIDKNAELREEFGETFENAKEFFEIIKMITSSFTINELDTKMSRHSKLTHALNDLIPHRSFLKQDKEVLDKSYKDIAKKIIKKHFPEKDKNDFTLDK